MTACACDERRKPPKDRAWIVIHRYCNFSAFNGYRRAASDYSLVRCTECRARWRTRAAYVGDLPDGPRDEANP